MILVSLSHAEVWHFEELRLMHKLESATPADDSAKNETKVPVEGKVTYGRENSLTPVLFNQLISFETASEAEAPFERENRMGTAFEDADAPDSLPIIDESLIHLVKEAAVDASRRLRHGSTDPIRFPMTNMNIGPVVVE
jgi:hypothetical protein